MSSLMNIGGKSFATIRDTEIISNTFDSEFKTPVSDMMVVQESSIVFDRVKVYSNQNDHKGIGRLLRIERSEIWIKDTLIHFDKRWNFDMGFPALILDHSQKNEFPKCQYNSGGGFKEKRLCGDASVNIWI